MGDSMSISLLNSQEGIGMVIGITIKSSRALSRLLIVALSFWRI
jgi:hypothetical protein